MTTSTTQAPTQVWLPGQAAAPEGPVDMTMMYVMHHAFRRDLAAFAAAIPATPVSDRAAWEAMLERWTGFATVLHHHHSGEDAGLWPLLLQHVDAAGDTAGRATLEAMEAEHDLIDPLLSACAEGLQAIAAGGTADLRAALAVRMVATRDSLGRHLAHEETDAITLMQRHLTAADWCRVEKEHFKGRVSLRELVFGVPWAAKGVPAEVRERAFSAAGPAFKVLWFLTRRRFDRLERRAFGHA